MLQCQRRSIATDTKKHGMTEAQKPRIAQEHIQRNGKNSKNRKGDKNIRIVDAKHFGKETKMTNNTAHKIILIDFIFHSSTPNNPLGRKARTMAIKPTIRTGAS